MDVVVYALCKKMVADAKASFGDVFSLKGKKASVSELPKTDNKVGDMYLVGPQEDGSYDEYYWTTDNKWELIGSTVPSLDDYITNTTLYAGESGTGTITNPAPGTLMYEVDSLKTIVVSKTQPTNLKKDGVWLVVE